jgi:hypothetical protein
MAGGEEGFVVAIEIGVDLASKINRGDDIRGFSYIRGRAATDCAVGGEQVDVINLVNHLFELVQKGIGNALVEGTAGEEQNSRAAKGASRLDMVGRTAHRGNYAGSG